MINNPEFNIYLLYLYVKKKATGVRNRITIITRTQMEPLIAPQQTPEPGF